MTYRLFPATCTHSLVKDSSGQWFVKAQVVDSNVVSLTALTASTNYAINQLLMRLEILTYVERDYGRLVIPRLKHNERSHTPEQIDYDLDGLIKWKSRDHAFIKVPCPFGAMYQ